jgi:signal transduction histidine kinase
MSVTGSKAPAPERAALRVLLIEDSVDDADLVADELRAGGYVLEHERVDTAAALRAALRARSWQLALCDYSMPGFNALAALAIIKEHRLDLPFIIISGVVGEESAVAAMRAGAHDFLVKGKLARLLPAVERELREAAVRSERAAMQQQLLLSDRLVQIGTLAAGIAHEINNPLAYVMGNIGLALEELENGTQSASVVAALRQALEGSERIRAITTDLRVFSRNDESEPRPVDLQRVLESAISMAWNQMRHRATLVRDFQPVPPIAANENRLGQVFLNLLINAAQAIPEGNADRHEIRVTLRQIATGVEIAVSDSGVGIAPEARENLFQPFFTTKPRGMGTGLGLSICQKIVQDIGGEISASAREPNGTTFRVCLPIGKVVASVQPGKPPAGPSTRRGRILVIDDEPQIVDIVKRVLRTEHDTVGVVGARSALALLQNDAAFDVIFCDLMMPEMSGVELFEELQRTAPELARRVVFLSGGAFTPTARQFLSQVENVHVPKPFDQKTLRAVVREQLGRLDEAPLANVTARP